MKVSTNRFGLGVNSVQCSNRRSTSLLSARYVERIGNRGIVPVRFAVVSCDPRFFLLPSKSMFCPTPSHQLHAPYIKNLISRSLYVYLLFQKKHISVDLTQQLLLQDVLALLVLLRRLVGAVVLPAHDLLALAAVDVAHHVPARGHVALPGLALLDVHDRVEQVRFAVLAAEVLAYMC